MIIGERSFVVTWVKLAAFWELIKFKITRAVIITAFLGYYLAIRTAGLPFMAWECLVALVAIAWVCAGACAFNHIIEYRIDARMSRTKTRPLPSKLIRPWEAIIFATALSLAGLIVMWVVFSPFLAWGSLATSMLYTVIYTPMKRWSVWNTTIGALPGALPVLGGAIAATETISSNIYIVFLVVFLWQHPHFYAIAWIYRDDYQKGGYCMLSLGDDKGKRTFGVSFILAFLMLGTTLILPHYHAALTYFYVVASIVLGLGFLFIIFQAFQRSRTRLAHRIVASSVFYLLLWIIVVVVDDYWL